MFIIYLLLFDCRFIISKCRFHHQNITVAVNL